MDTPQEKKWELVHGIQQGDSLSSRDQTWAEFNTKQEALDSLRKQEAYYRSLNYRVVWAILTSPDGVQQRLR